jgi:hypothetical protein
LTARSAEAAHRQSVARQERGYKLGRVTGVTQMPREGA